MASIVKILEEKKITVTLEYFGINDIATSWDVKAIIEDHDLIIQYFIANNDAALINIDDFFDYCYANKISKMEEIIPLINTEENKRIFSAVVYNLHTYLEAVKVGDVIKFINQNYIDLFDEKYRIYGLSHIALDFILNYQNGINIRVYKFLIKDYDYLILDNYNRFFKIFEKDNELFSELFDTGKILKLFSIRQDLIQNILASIICRNKENLIEKVNDIVAVLILREEKIVENINNENIIQYELEIKSFNNFLKKIKHQKANDFGSYIKEIEIRMSDYLLKKGIHRSYEIPVGEIISKLKIEGSWELKLLMLTHTNTDGRIQSSLNLASEGKKGLVDYVSTNLNTDEYYTRSHLQKLDVLQTVGSASWLGIINDKDLFQESLDWFRGYINFIFEKIGYEETEIDKDLLLLYQMIDNCKSIKENKDSQLEASLCYGTCMFICSFIEKILRLIYIELKREIEYIPIEKITLGELLSDGNSLYTEILGEYQLKHLRYFLLTDGDKKIGTNYRNSLAHYSSITSENINMFLVGKLMFLFTNIVTSFFYYFFMKQSEENIDN